MKPPFFRTPAGFREWLTKNHQQKAAWNFFHAQPASYRKAVYWWIMSAKKEETRLKRLEKLAAFPADGQRLPEFVSRKPGGDVRKAPEQPRYVATRCSV